MANLQRRSSSNASRLGIVCAVVGLTLSGQAPRAQGVPSPSPPPKEQPSQAAQPGNGTPKPLAVTIVESPEHAESGEAREAKSNKHDDRDLDAQIRAANAAENQIYPAWLAAILSAVGTFLIVWTLFLTRRANAISRDASRAWLSINVSDTGKFWLSFEDLDFHFDLILENHGAAPALNVFCKGVIIVGHPRDFNLPCLDDIAPAKVTDAECVVFPNSTPLGTEIVAELDGPLPEKSEINLVVVCRYRIVGHDDWRCSTRTFNLRPSVEMYTSGGRFQNGVCNLSIPENHTEGMDLLLKERNDCPPTAT